MNYRHEEWSDDDWAFIELIRADKDYFEDMHVKYSFDPRLRPVFGKISRNLAKLVKLLERDYAETYN